MYFKLFYRRLESRIMVLRDIASRFMDFPDNCALDGAGRAPECRRIKDDMDGAFASLMEQYREILSHYEQTSLFLETLLRRSHFEQGRYVLEPRPCNLRTQIVEPQIERYRSRLSDRGVGVALGPGATQVRDPMVLADVGLISQVVANLLSNAVVITSYSIHYTKLYDLMPAFLRYLLKLLKISSIISLDVTKYIPLPFKSSNFVSIPVLHKL